MSVLKYFKNTPRSPPHRATGLKCNFFLQICNEVPGKKGGLSPPLGRPLGPAHGRGRGAVAPPPRATGVTPLYKIQPPFSPHLSPKIPPKIQKKREE